MPLAVTFFFVGQRITPLVSPWLTTTKRESKPVEEGRLVISVENYSVVTKEKLQYSTTKIRSCLCKLLTMKPIQDEFSTLPLKEYGENQRKVG